MVALCCDRGVEAGLAEAEGGNMHSYLPEWVGKPAQLEADSGIPAPQGQEPSSSAPRAQRLLPKALLSAGVCH